MIYVQKGFSFVTLSSNKHIINVDEPIQPTLGIYPITISLSIGAFTPFKLSLKVATLQIL